MLERLIEQGFEVRFESHAAAILRSDFPEALRELEQTFASFSVPIEEIIGSGGGETRGTQRMRGALAALGWTSLNFEIRKTINGVERESISHKVDHVRTFQPNQRIALELEWNNKDPFFDRDLENFKRLHVEGAISVGVIVTRGTSLHAAMRTFVLRFAQENSVQSFDDLNRIGLAPTRRQKDMIQQRTQHPGNPRSFAEAWSSVFVSDKFGEATTHWRKLIDRVNRGVGNPCPLLLIGLPASTVRFERATPSAGEQPIQPTDEILDR